MILMKYVVEFKDDIYQETVEFHARTHDYLQEKVKQWMEDDGRFVEGDVYSDAGRYLLTIYL